MEISEFFIRLVIILLLAVLIDVIFGGHNE